MDNITVKFGGSSLADAAQFRKVADIIKADSARKYVVASAPGKRRSADTKVTDMLYAMYGRAEIGEDFNAILDQIEQRYMSIIDELELDFDLEPEIEAIRYRMASSPERDYAASRGEYLNAKILAMYLGFAFLDPAECILFDRSGKLLSEETNERLAAKLVDNPYTVIPGFYGADGDGNIVTFSRGGSDITGSLVARATKAEIYENWTDVSGILTADPRIAADAKVIEYISYRELRELSYMGASVLHEDAVFPAKKAGIPINIRNTNAPADKGTMIVSSVAEGTRGHVTGLAGKKGFSSVRLEKTMMNNEIGFGEKLLAIFRRHDIPFEHMPTGIDSICVIVNTDRLHSCRSEVLLEIEQQLSPDSLTIEDDLALIAVVGQGMSRTKGIAARIFSALASAGINIRMIDQGSGEMNIIVGIDSSRYEEAVRALSTALF